MRKSLAGEQSKEGVAGRGYRDKMACLGNEKPFNVARKQHMWGKIVAEETRETSMN